MANFAESPGNYLEEYGLINSLSSSAAGRVITQIQPNIETYTYKNASSYIEDLWSKALANDDFVRDVRGKGFELMIACALIKEGILPFYWQAEISFVPMANFDLVIYTKEIGPIVLSLKTSMRERFKQAEFEAQILRNVHRRSRTFLITMESHEAEGLAKKIDQGLVTGIEKVAVGNESSFDELISILKEYTPIEAPRIETIVNPRLIRNPV